MKPGTLCIATIGFSSYIPKTGRFVIIPKHAFLLFLKIDRERYIARFLFKNKIIETDPQRIYNTVVEYR